MRSVELNSTNRRFRLWPRVSFFFSSSARRAASDHSSRRHLPVKNQTKVSISAHSFEDGLA